MSEVTLAQALNEGLRTALKKDDRVLVFGEDIGRLGGVFRITDGLQKEFGNKRVFDTPLAESAIVGVSLGLALAGFKPVAEIQFDGFIYPGFNQIVSHLAKHRYRSRGTAGAQVVIRVPCAGEVGAAEHHSESPEAYFAHTPGLKVVVPSNAVDAFDLLTQSIADPDPVIFFEPKSRYWVKSPGTLGEQSLPIGKARVAREGDACTLIAYGAMVARCMEVAEAGAEDGVEIEVVDVRTLVPFDLETISASSAKTGRAIVVHEAPQTCGFGAEIAAQVQESVFSKLKAPVLRVTGFDTPYPPAKSERHYIPSLDRILNVVQRSLNY